MRVSFLVYGVLYVVFEMVGYQLEQVGWAEVATMADMMAQKRSFPSPLRARLIACIFFEIRGAGNQPAVWSALDPRALWLPRALIVQIFADPEWIAPS